ncbi:aldehyde dehydrogenase family protein [Microbacterium sp. ARD31]|uniref:aldehyde dehydrogenase family protein n=1 Tax=Microbacterium sp. ARD31 TaxID=2962576 RepID=UPI002882D17C|nr:aldehyde dehydrogenase family protein [Microbacterium sp. ARD31]MDT0183951.1 aldehyde dehydrogenase family protein [Microbacterium sp. ARD31]
MSDSTERDAGRVLADMAPWGTFRYGAWHPKDDAAPFEVHNPATGAVLATVGSGTAASVDAAVADARSALGPWRELSPRVRGDHLRRISALLAEHAEELAVIESLENGKPRRDALRFDVGYAIATFHLFAGLAETLTGEVIDQGSIEAHVLPEPYGVVGAILPFNWPPIHFAAKTAPAIAAGNTIVLKPGEQAPLTVLRMVELVNSVLPPGVVNAVAGMEAGIALASHQDVDRITFTGAPDTGRKVMASAARNLVPSTMELGGKNALVVFPDADIELTVAAAVEGSFFNQGEACTATSRILLHQDVYDEFAAKFARATELLRVGDGLDEATDIGPMVDARQRARVEGYLAVAAAERATLIAQGRTPTDEHLAGGHWVAPTLFGDVTADMRIAQEEIFGPVAVLMRFATEDEAVEIANGTAFGLTAAVFTSDAARGRRVALRLEAGMVFVNNYFRASLLGSPFGGVKDSGFGREGAAETLREFTRSKNIRYVSGRTEVPQWVASSRILAALRSGT